MGSPGWENVSAAAPCAICGKPDWCRRSNDAEVNDCYRECGPGGFAKNDKSGQSFWRHFKSPRAPGASSRERQAIEEEEQTGIGYERERADADTLNTVYLDLIGLLGLYEDHAKALFEKRGITAQEARALGYRSFPVGADARHVIEKLQERHGDKLLSVPGFDRADRVTTLTDGSSVPLKELRLSGSSGLLLPQRDREGRVVAMMLRLDEPAGPDPNKKPRRYLPLTSYTPSGCSAKIAIHVPAHQHHDTSIVRVIEGIIKADIATLRTGVLTLGIQSGGRWLSGVKLAEAVGAEGILLAPDADTRTNAGICTNLTHAANELAANGTLFGIETWAQQAGKGLDDVLHGKKQNEVLMNGGILAWNTLKTWLASSGAPRDPRVEARIVLDRVSENAKADPSYAFRPGIASAFGVLDAASVEVQRHLASLKHLLQRSGWRDFEKKVKDARTKKESIVRANQGKEVEARGGHVFKLGDQAEASGKLLDDLTPAGTKYDHGLCAFDRGSLFKYEDGVYKKLDEAALITRVADYSGSPIASGGVLRISSSFCKGTAEIAYARRARPGFFDQAPPGLAFTNGFLLVDPETKTVRLVPSSREHRVRVRYEFEFTPGGKPARFLAALERYFRKDADRQQKIACLQEFMGASIVGEAPRFARALVFRGTAGNDGKSTLAKILIKAMPCGAVASVPPQKFDNDYSRASLDGVLLNAVFELPEGDLIDAAPLKAIIVGDPTQARNPYQRPFDLKSRAGQLYICNRLFRVKDPDSAFRRRWIIIDFNDPLGAAEIDAAFVEQVVANEIPEIVSWALEGLVRRLQANEYTIPASSVVALNEWLTEYDTMGAFLNECAVVLDTQEWRDPGAWIKAAALYAEYATWAKANGHPPMSSTTFGAKLKARLNLKPKDVTRSDANYYPVKVKMERLIPSDAAMIENGKGITKSDLEPPASQSDSEAALTGTSGVAATLTVTPVGLQNRIPPHLRLVSSEPETDDGDGDDGDDDEYEAHRRNRWAVGDQDDS